TFATALADGSAYNVTVLTQPVGQICTITAGSGTLSGANVTNVTANCVDSYTIGGSVSGLTGTLVLQNNGGDDLILTADGAFTFATALADGSAYDVTVLTQPAGQICTITTGSGTLAGADVTNVAANCVSMYTIGGTVSGLSGTLVLQNNGGDDLTLTADGAFTFATALADGSAYDVTV
ncbi:MAG: 3-carboxymuconate cyclase, partial [Actinomycetia bacterium]|nr:3-carboxymuconate cyclase [Actinomycetes bacterium]